MAVIQAARPWLSSEDIQRGAQWFGDIGSQLQESSVGIFCLTQRNKNAPWILFEAGAIAKGVPSNRICTLLIDLQPSDVLGPLSQFNHTLPTHDEMLKLALTLNAALGEARLTDSQLRKSFDAHWSSFEKDFAQAVATNPEVEGEVSKPDSDDVLAEVLSSIRAMSARLARIEGGAAASSADFLLGSAFTKGKFHSVGKLVKNESFSPSEVLRLLNSLNESEREMVRMALMENNIRWTVANGAERNADGDIAGPRE